MEGILALRIAHHRTALATPNHSASKICYGLTLGDLKPPEGIEMLHLEEVCIYLQISSLPPIPDLDCYSCPGTFSSDIVPASPFEDLLRSELLETSSACLYQSPMLICSNQDIVPYSGENGSKVSNTTRIFREDSKMLEEDVDGFMLLERGSSGTAPNLEGHGLESDVDQYAEDVTEKGYSLNALVSLLETALELTIHDRAKIPLDIVVIENSIRLPLSEIVPTLWRTGYLSVPSK